MDLKHKKMKIELHQILKKTLILVLLLVVTNLTAQNFRTVWRTTAPNESITIPTTGGGYNYTVDWGDTTSDAAQTGDATHSYTVAGDYTVTISGTFPRVYFNNGGDKTKIRSVEEWGSSITWRSMQSAFYGCSNLVNNASDVPVFHSDVTTFNLTFQDCTSLGNGSATNWGSWNTTNITTMAKTFLGATSFNKDISGWNMTNVEETREMFRGATAFNQNISGWTFTKVNDMSQMFQGASAFNQNISGWSVSLVTNFSQMFRDAVSFDQNLSSWNVGSATVLQYMFTNVTLSVANYEALLIGWNAQTLQNNVISFAVASKYNSQAATDARTNMITTYNWGIEDQGRITNINWTGTTNTDWKTISNWDANTLPLTNNDVTIPNVTNDPIISSTTGATTQRLTINSGAILTVESGGSLIVTYPSTGNITYNVNVADDKWHLISSPVDGEQYDDAWNTANSINVSGAGNNDGVSTYNNTTSAIGTWDYFQTGAAATTFNQGQGYSLKRTGTGNYSFISAYPDSNVLKTITIGNAGTGTENRWNLIGNPFPSYIKVSELITANSANLTDTHEFVYVWDNSLNAGAGGYKTLVGADYIRPGQGFFVNADNSNADNFTITESLQSHQTGKTFYKNSNPSIQLFINDGSNSKFTEIVYENNSTTDLDRSFDAGTFTGALTSFSVYSHLVNNSKGVDFMRQSLPNNNYENMVIPIGINATKGKEIVFTSKAFNLPTGIKVFIEDTKTKTFTRLDETNSEYKVVLTNDLNGIGRFNLHTKNQVTLDVDTHFLEDVSIYKTSNSNLRITGLEQGKASIKLFSISGKQIMNVSFQTNGVSDISLPRLASGIYIVNLMSEKGKLNKKILID